ncbi:hypothetical protein [uncultured Flavobacterium sp.]|uniref:hypothetical protein n=1 Tax=uncultured Flavobacterium sp. TaxID=165435 RepID=UPI00293063FD|nr:hypothetical protein [uncultured Flavobacterium sp.]
MENEHKQILDKIKDIEILKLLKSEAEMALDESIASQTIITDKANTIFQILIVILFSILGFLVSKFPDIEINSPIIKISLFLIIVCSCSIWFLLKIIYPNLTYSKGTTPSKLLHSDIFIKDWEEISILKNRIYNLDKAIKENKIFQSNRIYHFKTAIYILLIGILLTTLYSLCII